MEKRTWREVGGRGDEGEKKKETETEVEEEGKREKEGRPPGLEVTF